MTADQAIQIAVDFAVNTGIHVEREALVANLDDGVWVIRDAQNNGEFPSLLIGGAFFMVSESGAVAEGTYSLEPRTQVTSFRESQLGTS